MAKCKYCRRNYTVESWYARNKDAGTVCPDCADKLSTIKGYWQGTIDFIRQIRCGGIVSGDEDSASECEESQHKRIKQKGMKEDGDGEFSVYGRWILSEYDEYDEDGDDYECGCTITIKPKGVMEVHGNLTLRNIGIEIFAESGKESCPAIIVDGDACFRNCHFVGHGARQAVICKGTLLLEDCDIDDMECLTLDKSLFEVVGDEDNWATEIMDGSSFRNCRSEGSLISTGEITFNGSDSLFIKDCKCKGPFVKSDSEFSTEMICSVDSLELMSYGSFSVVGFRRMAAKAAMQIKVPAKFSKESFEKLVSLFVAEQRKGWSTIGTEKIWLDLYKEYKRLPAKIETESQRKGIYLVLWQLICLYIIKGKHKDKNIARFSRMFSSLGKYKDKMQFWEHEVEKCMCDVLSVDDLTCWEDMPDAIRDAVIGE